MATNDDVVGMLRELRSQISTLADDNASLRKEMRDMKTTVTTNAPTSSMPVNRSNEQPELTA